MRHFLVEITYLVPFEQLAATVSDHRAFLQTGYDRAWVLMSGPQNPKTGGIVIARAPSLEDLQAFFDQDPYQIKHFASYRFVEFEPVKRQPLLENWITTN
jgi:uncharacterized protein YciI